MDKQTKKVRFTENATLPRVGKPDLVYHKDVEYDLRPDRANRWIKRNVAVEVKPTEATKPTTTGNDTTKGAADGNTVGSAAHVAGTHSGSSGLGAGTFPGSGRVGTGRGRAGGGGQSHT